MAEARFLEADRSQLSWDLIDLESLLPADHRARQVWHFAQGLDLDPFYEAILSREGHAGRPPADPRVLLALWLFATLEGVGSARELARLVGRDVAYRWLAGGVPVNHHGLSDFRVGWSQELDRLLTESVAALVEAGLVSLDELAIDGTKIRSPASARSFTRGGRLERIERAAAERVAKLKAEIESDPAAGKRRREAAIERAACEAKAKVDKAREALERLRKEKQKREKTHPEEEKAKDAPAVSLSDPDARRMRFADGAVRAGYNLQTVSVPTVGLILTVEATDRRNDKGLAVPMVKRVVARFGRPPARLLIDEGYASRDDIETLARPDAEDRKTLVYMPPPGEKPVEALTPKAEANRRFKRKAESAAVQEWRQRMATDEAREIFRQRKRVELIHAQYKNRGLDRLTVRGIAKAQAVALWHALAINLTVIRRLTPQAA